MPNVRTWIDVGREPDFLAGGERKGEGKKERRCLEGRGGKEEGGKERKKVKKVHEGRTSKECE